MNSEKSSNKLERRHLNEHPCGFSTNVIKAN